MSPFSIKEAVKFGWETTKHNLGIILGASVLYALFVMVVPNMVSGAFDTIESPAAVVLAIVLFLVAWAVSLIVQIGYSKVLFNLHDGKQTSVIELFTHYDIFWKYLGTNILYNLIVGIPIIAGLIAGSIVAMTTKSDGVIGVVFAALALLVIPAVYLSLKYGFSLLGTIDRGLRPIAALKMSAEATRGVKVKLLLFWFAVVGINLVGLLALVAGLLITIPLSFVAYVHIYRQLAGQAPAASFATSAGEPVIEA